MSLIFQASTQFFNSTTINTQKQNQNEQILITNDIITTPRQQDKSLNQYLFKDHLNRSQDQIQQQNNHIDDTHLTSDNQYNPFANTMDPQPCKNNMNNNNNYNNNIVFNNNNNNNPYVKKQNELDQIYNSPQKQQQQFQIEMISQNDNKQLQGSSLNIPFKNIKNGMSYFYGKRNLTISEQEMIEQLDDININNATSSRQINNNNANGNVYANGNNNNANLPVIWRYKFFNILGWIAKYIRYIRLRLIYFHPNEYLSQLHFDIINDVSYFNPPNELSSNYFSNLINRDKLALMKEEKNFSNLYKSFIKSTRKVQRWLQNKTKGCTKQFYHMIENIRISQIFFKYWDIWMMLIIIVEMMFVSLKITYDGFINQDSFNIIQIPLLIFLFLDILLSFFKGFQDKGVYQIEARACFKNYLKGHFSLDIICLLIYMIAYYSDFLAMYCIFIIRLVEKYYRYQLTITENFQLNEKFGNEKVKLIELVLTIFLLAHLFSCVWYWVGKSGLHSQQNDNNYISNYYYTTASTTDATNNTTNNSNNNNYTSTSSSINDNNSSNCSTNKTQFASWVEAYDLDSSPWVDRYVASLFWVFTTMTTIGFGDIVPQNKSERLVAICIMMLSCFIFAYSVNSIGVLLNAINEKESIHRLRLKSMNSYMNDKKISQTLQSKVRCYLDYIYQEEKNGTSQNESISLDVLNNNLKQSLLNEANYHVLVKMKIFNVNNYSFSVQFMQDLTIKMEEKIYFPDDVISHQGQIDPQIYFVSKGEIKIIVKKSISDQKPSLLSSYTEGMSFGQYNFFSLQATPYTTIATRVTTIKYLRYSDFIQVIKKYPEDFEKYCMLKESLLLQQNFDILNITCSLCSWGNHQEINCPLVNFKPQKNLVICKFDHSTAMERNWTFKRKLNRKPNSYSINQIVSEQAREFQEDKGINNIQELSNTPHPNFYLNSPNYGFHEFIHYSSSLQKQVYNNNNNNNNNYSINVSSSKNINNNPQNVNKVMNSNYNTTQDEKNKNINQTFRNNQDNQILGGGEFDDIDEGDRGVGNDERKIILNKLINNSSIINNKNNNNNNTMDRLDCKVINSENNQELEIEIENKDNRNNRLNIFENNNNYLDVYNTSSNQTKSDNNNHFSNSSSKQLLQLQSTSNQQQHQQYQQQQSVQQFQQQYSQQQSFQQQPSQGYIVYDPNFSVQVHHNIQSNPFQTTNTIKQQQYQQQQQQYQIEQDQDQQQQNRNKSKSIRYKDQKIISSQNINEDMNNSKRKKNMNVKMNINNSTNKIPSIDNLDNNQFQDEILEQSNRQMSILQLQYPPNNNNLDDQQQQQQQDYDNYNSNFNQNQNNNNNNNIIQQLCIKGDVIEIDQLKMFQTYRYRDNYVFLIEAYNLIQESHRSKLNISTSRRTKRHHKTYKFNQNIHNQSSLTISMNN